MNVSIYRDANSRIASKFRIGAADADPFSDKRILFPRKARIKLILSIQKKSEQKKSSLAMWSHKIDATKQLPKWDWENLDPFQV